MVPLIILIVGGLMLFLAAIQVPDKYVSWGWLGLFLWFLTENIQKLF